ncbi:MAG: hypothetical protein KAJ29_02665 [Alphaproteobacteria bacterium]|nr:hypothetical protein [Alphaproteobacteria bacterium]
MPDQRNIDYFTVTSLEGEPEMDPSALPAIQESFEGSVKIRTISPIQVCLYSENKKNLAAAVEAVEEKVFPGECESAPADFSLK